jgi:reactive chlorine resistance protein C
MRPTSSSHLWRTAPDEWGVRRLSVTTFSAVLAVVELTVAALIAVKPLAPKASLVGSFLVKDVVLLAVALWTLGDAVWTLRSEPVSR